MIVRRDDEPVDVERDRSRLEALYGRLLSGQSSEAERAELDELESKRRGRPGGRLVAL